MNRFYFPGPNEWGPCHVCGSVETFGGERCGPCAARAWNQPTERIDIDEDDYDFNREQRRVERAVPQSPALRKARREALDDDDFVLD